MNNINFYYNIIDSKEPIIFEPISNSSLLPIDDFIVDGNKEDELNISIVQSVDLFPNIESLQFLGKKRDNLKNNKIKINYNSFIDIDISQNNLNLTEEINQLIEYTNNNQNNESIYDENDIENNSITNKNVNNSSTNNETNKISKKNIIYKRAAQKDNFSLKLFKNINNWICKSINKKINNTIDNKTNNIKIYRPNYDIFTHNSNSIDIYIFLNIKFKYILCMSPKDKDAFNDLLIELGIKKPCKKKETTINKGTKEYRNALKLLLINEFIKENEKIDINQLNSLIIKLLIKEGLKDKNEKLLYKKDKDNIIQLLIKNGEKKSYNFQNKNKKIIEEIEKNKDIKELNMTLKELIISFYNSEEFKNFSKEVQQINNYVKNQKKNKYSLLDNEDNNKGFLKMIEDDCTLSEEKKKIVKQLTNYFSDKNINEEEINNYRKKYPIKKFSHF